MATETGLCLPLAVMDLHTADLAVLALYLLGITLIGVWAARRVVDTASFIMPRRFGKAFMVFHSFGTGTHSDQAVSVAAKSFTNGLSGIWYQWLWLFVTPFYWLIAPMMRRFRALTTADVFYARYAPSVAALFAIICFVQYTVNIGLMLKGSSAVIEASTGLSPSIAIPIMTVLFVIYGMAGGLSAAIVTDFIQGVLTVLFSFVLLPYALNAVGGFAGLQEKIADPHMFSLVAPTEITAFFITIVALNGLVGIVAQPHVMGNCAAGRTELDGQVGFMGGNLLKRICTIPWAVTGLAGVAFFAGREIHPDNVYGALARELLPLIMPGMLGLFLAGLLASVMSSCDSFMIATSGLFTENLYRPLFPDRSEKHYLWVARGVSLAVVGSGVLFAYEVESVVDALEIFWQIPALMGIAFWMGLFWKRMNVAGAWAATVGAFGVFLIARRPEFAQWIAQYNTFESAPFATMVDGLWQTSLPWQMIMYLVSGAMAGVVVSLLTPAVSRAKLDRFYNLIQTPVVPGEQPERPCTIPSDAPQPHKPWIASDRFFIPRPTWRTVIGFGIGWVFVAVIIAIFYAITLA